ncbi:MAG: magnesium transporter [Thermomicrobiales bacterium]|nr:magnesium transporter [Thermomicrobiales bacterium]
MEYGALLDEVRTLIADRRREGIVGLTSRIGPAEWAKLVPSLEPSEVSLIIHWLPEEELPKLLAELDPHEAAGILRTLARSAAASVLAAMDPDDATDIVEVLPDTVAEQILVQMAPFDAAELRSLLAYPADSAGGIMTPSFVAVSPDVRTNQAIAALRVVAGETDSLYYVYVLDGQDHLLGVLPLRDLVLSPPDRLVSEFMVTDPLRVRAEAEAETAARLLRDHHLLAVPVVDGEDRLLGIVTVDDATDVLEDALIEDYLRQAGTDAEAMERRNPVQVARLRLPWLLGTMVIELGAGLVISGYNRVLTEVILLASFMPVISAVSGNVGLQAAAIVVRGLDTGHVTTHRWGRQVARELATSLLMALACGLVLGVVGAVWSRHLPFGLVIGGAMTCSMLTAGFMGTVIPMLSKRLGFDPATTAGPFETAFQDVVGFAVFLWLASRLVNYLH